MLRTEAPRKAILHTAVSNGRSLYGQFNTGDSCSHFYVDKDGNVEQYIDTIYKSAADYLGNGTSISIESWDGDGSTSVIEATPWNSDQQIAIAKLLKWISAYHDIPLTKMTTSRYVERGVGYHKLGVVPFKVADGEKWSKSDGKVCPGAARISQVSQLVSRAATIEPWSGRPPLRIDGSLGPATITRWQEIMGTPVDGIISQPSTLVAAVQRHLKLHTSYTNLLVDGYGIQQGADVPGTDTVRALQEYLGMPPLYGPGGLPYYDGYLTAGNSSTVRGLQVRLNKGFF